MVVMIAVFSILCLHALLQQGCHGNRYLTFLPCQDNRTFTGHVIKAVSVTADWHGNCQLYCYVGLTCVSYNLGPIKGKERLCELSNSDHVVYPSHVINQTDYVYCPIKNPCSSSACAQGTICQPNWSFQTYRCLHDCRTCPFFRKCKTERGCFGYTYACSRALGMEDQTIPDSAITANSVHWAHQSLKSFGRLKNRFGWAPSTEVREYYLQIVLGPAIRITRLATQGCMIQYPHGGHDNGWVTVYHMRYGNSTELLQLYYSNGARKDFTGNSDVDTVKINSLPWPVVSSILRFYPYKWATFICMRVELYGCK